MAVVMGTTTGQYQVVIHVRWPLERTSAHQLTSPRKLLIIDGRMMSKKVKQGHHLTTP